MPDRQLLEPAIMDALRETLSLPGMTYELALTASAVISLKRIADRLERIHATLQNMAPE